MNKPKYNIGDKVWVIDNHVAEESEICGIKVGQPDTAPGSLPEGEIEYSLRWTRNPPNRSIGGVFREKYIYPTKEELIKSL